MRDFFDLNTVKDPAIGIGSPQCKNTNAQGDQEQQYKASDNQKHPRLAVGKTAQPSGNTNRDLPASPTGSAANLHSPVSLLDKAPPLGADAALRSSPHGV